MGRGFTIDKRFLIKSSMTALSIILALVVGAIIISASGTDPLKAYGYLISGALGDQRAVSETLVRAIPLIFSGLAFTFSLRCGIFNMGVEGQFLIGAMGSAACLMYMNEGTTNSVAAVLLSLAGGTAAGCLWGCIPGLLKACFRANEIIISWFLNYIAMHLANFLYSGPLMQTDGVEPKTALVPESFQLAKIVPWTRLHSGLIIVIVVAVLVHYFLFYTSMGMQCRAVGLNPVASKTNGMSVKRIALLAFIVSSAISGLGGAVELHGVQFRVQNGFGGGYGFDGISIALIGQLTPVGTIIVALGFAVLRAGSGTMQAATSLPSSIVDIIMALVILFVIMSVAINNLPLLKNFYQRMKSDVFLDLARLRLRRTK